MPAPPPPPDLSITACLVESPTAQKSPLIWHLDVRENKTDITLHNVIAECEKGCWTITWNLDAEVKRVGLHPLAAMRVASPPYTISPCRLQEFEKALIEQLDKRRLAFFLVTDYESRFIPDFKGSVRELDFDENRIPLY
jgi:hypothetical protein